MLVVLLPLGGATWTVALTFAPSFSPTVHNWGSQALESGEQSHALKR